MRGNSGRRRSHSPGRASGRSREGSHQYFYGGGKGSGKGETFDLTRRADETSYLMDPDADV
eukprot:1131148-Lingulodinium_polyedra.AAC.1